MLKKCLAIIGLIFIFSGFLVIFGGIAIIDISIKLMWLSFSAIMAFACNSLGWNISLSVVNKLLAKQRVLPGALTVAEAPAIRSDRMVLYNLYWHNPQGKELLHVHMLELRGNIYQIIWGLLFDKKHQELINHLKEIILQQPRINLDLATDNLALPQLGAGKEAAATAQQLEFIGPKLYIENGTAQVLLSGQELALENINGGMQLPLQEYHFYCRLEGELVSIQSLSETVMEVRGGKISLRKLYGLLQPYKPLHLDLLEGAVGDFQGKLVKGPQGWALGSLAWRLEDVDVKAKGILLEDVEGRFNCEDMQRLIVKKLSCKFKSHTVRVDGSLELPRPEHNAYIYDFKLRSDRICLKSGVDINIFDGFRLHGSLVSTVEQALIDLAVDGMLRLDIPEQPAVKVENFTGAVKVSQGVLTCERAQVVVNGRPVVLQNLIYDFNLDTYSMLMEAQGLPIKVYTPNAVAGKISFTVSVQGNWQEQRLELLGSYQVEDFSYGHLGSLCLRGRVQLIEGKVRLEDNYCLLGDKEVPVHCNWNHDGIEYELEKYLDDAKAYMEEKKQQLAQRGQEAVDKTKALLEEGQEKLDATKAELKEELKGKIEQLKDRGKRFFSGLLGSKEEDIKRIE